MTRQDRIGGKEMVIPSPISFVLMGPREKHRGVIARSADANVDLIGLDDRVLEWTDEPELTHNPGHSVFSRNLPLRTHIVRTGAKFSIGNAETDSRLSNLSFAWRGLATARDVERIREAFSTMSADLADAMRRGDFSALEWNIAPLILLCQRTKERLEARHERRRALMLTAAVIYGAIILAALLQYYVARIIA